LTEIGRQAPTYYKGISDSTQKLERFYQRIPPPARESVKETVSETIHSVGAYVQSTAVSTATFALGYAPWLVLIPILAFFLLKDADNFRRAALQMLPRGRIRWRGDELFQDVNSTLAAYIRAQLIACLLIGVLCTIGFMLIGVPYALVLGIIAGFVEFIPLAGPLFIFVLAVAVSSFHSSGEALAVFIFLAVLRIVHDYVTYPRIIGQGIHLHPLAVILAILCGAELAGRRRNFSRHSRHRHHLRRLPPLARTSRARRRHRRQPLTARRETDADNVSRRRRKPVTNVTT
jgi:predicted PurR-regulated permease PerM